MQVHASVFKAYDIRGIVGKTIDEAFAEHLGRAFGTEALAAGEKAVAVGFAAKSRSHSAALTPVSGVAEIAMVRAGVGMLVS